MHKLEKFQELGVSDNILRALKKKGFEEPTPIQEEIIPKLLENDRDLIGQAQTGTGKTAAFGIPLIENIYTKVKKVQAIILTPTRELAIQVSEEINSLKGRKRLFIVPIYGGQSIEQQLYRLQKGVHIVVGTPGRVIDHIHRGSLDLSGISYFILDEADEMLNMGFIDDVEEILSSCSRNKRIMLFSATMPKPIINLAKKYMENYDIVQVKAEQLTIDLVDQIYFEVREFDKFEALCRIIDMEPEFYGLVFCRTKINVDRIANKLIDRGYDAEALHGDISQYQRERILLKFKNKRTNVLVATDVAARGIDISDLTHVINFSLPQNPESYVHRIGRTGRAGKEGTAVTFVTPEEYRKLIFIKRIAKTDIRKEKLPEIEDVIKSKRARIADEIHEIIDNGSHERYLETAGHLMRDRNPEDVIAAMIKHSFEEDFDKSKYSEISNVSIDKKGKTRLFVAKGREDDMTPRTLLQFIESEAKVDGRKIRNIRIFDKFSFIEAPFEEAEIILEIFKKNKRGKRPIIERAKEKKKKR